MKPYKDLQLENLPVLIAAVKKCNEEEIKEKGVQKKVYAEWILEGKRAFWELSIAMIKCESMEGLRTAVVRAAIKCATICLNIAEMNIEAVEEEG